MLTTEDNEILTRVGPGTLMGNLLRRYWTPALLSTEVPAPDSPPVRVRLLGEDLVAFRDTNGTVGLLAQNCPHRGASLFFGRNEECGLRCVYHGWKFDVDGSCVDMPSEPAESNFKSKVRATAYPTHESGGVIWAYLGPQETQPGFRDFGSEDLPREEWRASKVLGTCNWLQGLEGNVDTAHIGFLHRSFANLRAPYNAEEDRPGTLSTQLSYLIWGHDPAPRLEVEPTWYGFRYAGLRRTPNGHTHARVTDFIMPYLTYIATIPFGGTMCILMVPRDDESHWRWHVLMKPLHPSAQRLGSSRMGGIIERSQWAANDYLIDREAQRTESYSGIAGGALPQDQAMTESMGAIYDRTKEHLGTTDRAIIHMRRLLINSAKDLARGIEPIGVDASLPYKTIRSAEKILAAGEDWRLLGTDEDPAVIELTAEMAQKS
jgi:phenylpropionate dioxygenase-like ring-hydroxylating dioxygenase large terminal subunit